METPNLSHNPAAKPGAFQGDPEFNPGPEESTCPRCDAKLIDPAGLGWCKACGYCKSLEEDKARIPIETKPRERKPSFLGLVEFGQILAKLPNWTWVMIGGIGVVLAFNIPLTGSLPPDCLQRAALATFEIILGALMVFGAQIWSLCVLAPNDDRLHFKDAVIPGKLWGLTLKKLPETRGQVWLATWGLACILSGIFVIGGLDYWQNYLPKKIVPPAAIEQPQ